MAAASPFLHIFVVLLFALSAQWAVAVSISFGQWGSSQDSQALAAQIAMLAGSGENCVQGKHLPEFYVLGAKKAATSSLYIDLENRGAVAAPGSSWKEWKFFLKHLGLPAATLHAKWLEELPECGALPAVMGDFSVCNLQLNPLPSDFAWSQDLGVPTDYQIEEYLKYFDAKQFFFAPDKEYFAVDPPKFSADLLAWLHIPSTPWHRAHHANSQEHPELDEDLPSTAPARKAYEAFMAPENERLVRTLAQAHTQGAVLAGYAGLPGDVAAVRDWLVQNW